MFTVILAFIESKKTNKGFEPFALYSGTVFLDILFIAALVDVFNG